jgi:hypothetical protein
MTDKLLTAHKLRVKAYMLAYAFRDIVATDGSKVRRIDFTPTGIEIYLTTDPEPEPELPSIEGSEN